MLLKPVDFYCGDSSLRKAQESTIKWKLLVHLFAKT